MSHISIIGFTKSELDRMSELELAHETIRVRGICDRLRKKANTQETCGVPSEEILKTLHKELAYVELFGDLLNYGRNRFGITLP